MAMHCYPRIGESIFIQLRSSLTGRSKFGSLEERGNHYRPAPSPFLLPLELETNGGKILPRASRRRTNATCHCLPLAHNASPVFRVPPRNAPRRLAAKAAETQESTRCSRRKMRDLRASLPLPKPIFHPPNLFITVPYAQDPTEDPFFGPPDLPQSPWLGGLLPGDGYYMYPAPYRSHSIPYYSGPSGFYDGYMTPFEGYIWSKLIRKATANHP
ncbi:hypothetical protein Hypma_014280 [Hypsizygus marmoreus]|uniref:Uncharacterized protein n=1 Tax=Hypsizygus marmoreus TaxID=39966 RepID=A0A369JH44_HYPMA|nr:hypothetical protein Hypma_014280 [Hypsizygus marmoreus]